MRIVYSNDNKSYFQRKYFDSNFRHFDFILFNNKASVNYKRNLTLRI